MKLIPYVDQPADLELTRALETDPEVMRELGGPIPDEDIAAIHDRRAKTVVAGDWWLKIVPGGDAAAIGTIGIWPHDVKGADEHEIGWMVLPAFQGRGIASEALRMILEWARAEPRFQRIHAYPATANPASNALCRKNDFELIGEVDVDYAGRPLHCYHWALPLR